MTTVYALYLLPRIHRCHYLLPGHLSFGWIVWHSAHFTYSMPLDTLRVCFFVLVSCWPISVKNGDFGAICSNWTDLPPTSMPHHLQNFTLVFAVVFPGCCWSLPLLMSGTILSIGLLLCAGKTVPPPPPDAWACWPFGFVYWTLDTKFPRTDLERIASCSNLFLANLTVSATRVLIPVNCKEHCQSVHH